MIRIKKGNLVELQSGVIVHGCNSRGVMGAGFALKLKTKYPEIFNKYKILCDSYNDNEKSYLIGNSVICEINKDLTIVNAITQEGYGRNGSYKYVSYDALDNVFKFINELVKNGELNNNINFPMIGCNLGGGNWNVVKEIIDHRLDDQYCTKTLWIHEEPT